MPETEILNYIYHRLPQASIPISSSNDKKPRLLIKLIATLYKYRNKVNGHQWYTYGQELEIWDNWVDKLVIDLTQNFLNGHYDGSGPWEFILFPTKYNDPLPAFIITEMERKGYIIIRPTDEMGNHLHYRPAPIGESTATLWWKTWTNLFTLTILYIRMLSAHGSALRERWHDWAKFSSYYLFEDKIPTNKDINEIVKKLKLYYGRSYEHITLNRNRKKILTIEIRMCEAHPLKAWAFIYLITEITRQEKYPLFLVKDYQKLDDFYYDLAQGNITDYDNVKWEDIGLKPTKTIHDEMPLRRILINIYRTYIKLKPKTPQSWLARKILEYVYDEEKDIITKNDVEEFYQYLRLKKREETLANILTRAVKNI